MDAACNSLRQVAAGLQQCLEEEAPKERKYVLLLKGLACIAELKNQNQRLCEETERVSLPQSASSLQGFTTGCSNLGNALFITAPDCCMMLVIRTPACRLQMQSSTAEAKAQYDAAELSLQNLLYEKGHYLKEIRACQSFR